jgi:hypothetical protein
MKIAVQSLLLLFLACQALGDEDEPIDGVYDNDDGGYGVTDAVGYGNFPSAGKEDCLVAESIASVPFASSGDTQETLGQGFDEAQTCFLVNDLTRGVWFQLSGDGLCYNASSLGSAYNAVIAVYAGDADCEGLVCLTQNFNNTWYESENEDEDEDDDLRTEVTTEGYGGDDRRLEDEEENDDDFGLTLTSEVLWRTEVGETYYILLGGLFGDAGSYEFSLDVSV